MVATFKVREFTAITRQLETIRAELPKGASVSHVIALLHIFDICGDSGIKAKDIEILTGESAPTISRMLKAFYENYNLIRYEQFNPLGPKLIFLTDKGEALKRRVFLAKEDYQKLAQVQQASLMKMYVQELNVQKLLNVKTYRHNTESKVVGLMVHYQCPYLKLRKLAREKLLKDLGDLRGQQLVRRIKELKAGQSQYVFDQINRAKRTTITDGFMLSCGVDCKLKFLTLNTVIHYVTNLPVF